jgi:hypothetical protein
VSRKKKKARVASARPIKNQSCTSKNIPDLQKTQSPWSDAPADNWKAELQERLEKDAYRLEATSEDDRLWFEAHPGRNFHIRSATPHEPGTGLACGWVVVARCSIGRVRLPLPFPTLAARDASEADTEEKARELFDCLTGHVTAVNTDPFLFGVIEEIRVVRHG